MQRYPERLDQFHGELADTLSECSDFFRDRQIVGLGRIDHIGWTCANSEEFDAMRKLLEHGYSEFVFQSIISGRRIAFVKLKQKFATSIGPLFYLELADFKPGNVAISGFNHVEVCPLEDIEYKELVSLASSRMVLREVVRKHHTTHEADIREGMRFCCSTEPLITKIMRDQMP